MEFSDRKRRHWQGRASVDRQLQARPGLSVAAAAGWNLRRLRWCRHGRLLRRQHRLPRHGRLHHRWVPDLVPHQRTVQGAAERWTRAVGCARTLPELARLRDHQEPRLRQVPCPAPVPVRQSAGSEMRCRQRCRLREQNFGKKNSRVLEHWNFKNLTQDIFYF